MKIAHWTLHNGSGMNYVAKSIVDAEKAIGVEAVLVNPALNVATYENLRDVDIHVSHTHVRDDFLRTLPKRPKLVWIAHGTPEHVFQTAVESGSTGAYGHADGVMLNQHWMRTADALVTFWPRHQAIIKSLCDRRTVVDCFPFGVDRTQWYPIPNASRFVGSPSLFTAENAHYIKWPLDLILTWPWVYPRVKGAPCLHMAYLPTNLHRWFFPWLNRNGSSYTMHIANGTFSHESLRGAFSACDYFIGLVRYGDFNMLSHQANACGIKTISYTGNPYSDFWLPEGDQRIIADELVKILNGEVKPREKEKVPDIAETAKAFVGLYERLLT